MSNNLTTNGLSAEQIVENLEQAIDFYHSMDLDETDLYWYCKWNEGLELIERALNLPEDSLINIHDEWYGTDCPHEKTPKENA